MRYPTKYVLVTDLDDTKSIWNINNNKSSSNSLSSSSNLASNVINNNKNSNNTTTCSSGNGSSSSKSNNNNNLLLVENNSLTSQTSSSQQQQQPHHPNNNSSNMNNNNGVAGATAAPTTSTATSSTTANTSSSNSSNTKASLTAPLSNSVPDTPTNDLGNPLSMHIPLRTDVVLPERAWQDCIASDTSKLRTQSATRDDNIENASGTANGLGGESSCPNNNNCWEFGNPTQKYTCVCVR